MLNKNSTFHFWCVLELEKKQIALLPIDLLLPPRSGAIVIFSINYLSNTALAAGGILPCIIRALYSLH